MLRHGERPVTYEEFLRIALELRCAAASALERPRVGAACRAYTATVADVLAADTYAVRFRDARSGNLVDWNHPHATPLTFRDLVQHGDHLESLLAGWGGASGEWSRGQPYLALHCAGCERIVMIDGMRRLAWLASEEEIGQELFIVEQSGFHWPRSAADMGVVCACR